MLVDKERVADFHPNESHAEPWANSIVAYVMAFSALLSALTALEAGRTAAAKLENLAMLAHWSKRYAVQAYHLAKVLGLLKTRDGPVRESAKAKRKI